MDFNDAMDMLRQVEGERDLWRSAYLDLRKEVEERTARLADFAERWCTVKFSEIAAPENERLTPEQYEFMLDIMALAPRLDKAAAPAEGVA